MTEHNCTKKLCKDCGKVKPVGEFYKKTGPCGRTPQCIDCTKIRRKSHNIDLDKKRARNRRWGVKRNVKWKPEWYNPGKPYGLSKKDYDALMKKSNGRCEICGITPKKLVIDHDHETGKIRGLLCPQCNAGLGMAKDNPSILKQMVRYLTKRSM